MLYRILQCLAVVSKKIGEDESGALELGGTQLAESLCGTVGWFFALEDRTCMIEGVRRDGPFIVLVHTRSTILDGCWEPDSGNPFELKLELDELGGVLSEKEGLLVLSSGSGRSMLFISRDYRRVRK